MKRLLVKKSELLLIFLGVNILAIGINFFIAPLNLVTGGLSGLGILIMEISENLIGYAVPLWMTTLAFNIPLFAISIKQRGFDFAKKSLYAVGMLSFALWYLEFVPNPLQLGDDLFLAAVYGGICIGIGIGLVLRASATTGGTDMLATILKFKVPKLPIAQIMLIIDGFIIMAGFFLFGPHKAMYAIIAVFITSKMIGSVLEGTHFAKAAFIMSDHNEEIAKAIMERIPRGTTGIKAKGMYSKREKDMLFVVVSQKEITKLREIIKEIDHKAFVTIADVKEVLGEGFIEDYNSLSL